MKMIKEINLTKARNESIASSSYYSAAAVAEMLGVSTAAVYGLIRRRQLRALRVGRSIRLEEGDVRSFLKVHWTVPQVETAGSEV